MLGNRGQTCELDIRRMIPGQRKYTIAKHKLNGNFLPGVNLTRWQCRLVVSLGE